MVRIDVTTLISRPVQEVWDFFIDLTNSPNWTRSGSELRQTSDGPLGIGTVIESVGQVFGRKIKSQTLVVTQYEPGRLVSFDATVKLLGKITGGFTFEDVAGATRLSRWSEGPLGPLGPILAPLVRRSQQAELASIKRLVEARG